MGTVWHFLCSSNCSGVFMNLWHTSHSNIRVIRWICRWRSNIFFVLQTKLQKTHSKPEKQNRETQSLHCGPGRLHREWQLVFGKQLFTFLWLLFSVHWGLTTRHYRNDQQVVWPLVFWGYICIFFTVGRVTQCWQRRWRWTVRFTGRLPLFSWKTKSNN